MSADGEVVRTTARALALDPDRLAGEGLAALALELCAPRDRDRLRGLARHQAAARLVVEREIAEVLHALHAAAIPAVPWKGLALAGRWPAGTRPVGDLDLLIDPARLEEAIVTLCARGWRRAPEDRQGLVRRGPTGAELLPPPDRTLLVDLHARPFRSVGHRIEVAPLLARARSGALAGAPCLLLDAADELHLVLVHAAKHALSAIKWRLDAALLAAAADEATFSTLAERARAARTERPIGLVLAAIGHPGADRFAPPAWIARVLDRRFAATASPSRADAYLLELLLEPGLRARLRMLAGVAERVVG